MLCEWGRRSSYFLHSPSIWWWWWGGGFLVEWKHFLSFQTQQHIWVLKHPLEEDYETHCCHHRRWMIVSVWGGGTGLMRHQQCFSESAVRPRGRLRWSPSWEWRSFRQRCSPITNIWFNGGTEGHARSARSAKQEAGSRMESSPGCGLHSSSRKTWFLHLRNSPPPKSTIWNQLNSTRMSAVLGVCGAT